MDVIRSAVEVNVSRQLPSVPFYQGKIQPQLGAINVCGNGPSLRTKCPKVGPVACLNGSWRAYLKATGQYPDYIIAYDPDPENIAWFKDAPRSATYLLGSRMVPEVFELLKHHKVFIWHTFSEPEFSMGLRPVIGGGPTVGASALNLLAAIGYQHFDLYGYDSCWADDGSHHAAEQNWAIEPPQPFQIGNRVYFSSPWMVAQLETMIEQIFKNRLDYTVTVHDGGALAAAVEEQTLEVLYDLNKAPGSFDFMHSLFNVANCMMENEYCKLRVHFKPGEDQGFRPNEVIFLSHAGKTRMLNHVVRPMLTMFAAEEVGELTKPLEFSYSPQQSLASYRATGNMPTFKPSLEARKWAWENFDDAPITITLRECTYWPQRNSDVFEWIKFARYIGGSKRVIFLRDTDCVGQPFEFETCDEASIDLHKRLALYRRASMNFFVMNGPASLVYYTQDTPYAVFLTKAPGYACYDPVFLQRFIGIDPYGQFPWADTKRQRLIYADDDFEVIKEAYLELTK